MSSVTTAFRWPSRRLLLAGLLGLAVALTVAASASAQPAYHLVNENSGKALMPAGGSTAWGTPIFQRTVQNVGAQHWFLNAEGGGWYSLKNRQSQLCIHPSNWSPVSGAYLLQASCVTNNGARKWYLFDSDPNSPNSPWGFSSYKTGLYMDVEESSTTNNALAVQATYSTRPSQRWRLVYAGNY
jgi:cytochrome c